MGCHHRPKIREKSKLFPLVIKQIPLKSTSLFSTSDRVSRIEGWQLSPENVNSYLQQINQLLRISNDNHPFLGKIAYLLSDGSLINHPDIPGLIKQSGDLIFPTQQYLGGAHTHVRPHTNSHLSHIPSSPDFWNFMASGPTSLIDAIIFEDHVTVMVKEPNTKVPAHLEQEFGPVFYDDLILDSFSRQHPRHPQYL